MGQILVVDDDADIRNLTLKIFSHTNHQIQTAKDALEAMEILSAHTFDLLLTDGNLPYYSGLELVKTVRHDPRFKNLKIAMLTGLRSRKDIENAIRLGINDYIVKPLDIELFINKVDQLLKHKSSHHPHQLQLPLLSSLRKATLLREVEVTMVSENGLTLLTSHEPQVGELLELETELFQLMGIPAPQTQVQGVMKMNGGRSWNVQLKYLNLNKESKQKIRSWLFSRQDFQPKTYEDIHHK